MPDYRELLEFLAKNPPQFDAERALHASLLELLASCLRSETTMLASPGAAPGGEDDAAPDIEEDHVRWVTFG